jgi:vitamin-K-epoxide reductase (warfarin-sensitive)
VFPPLTLDDLDENGVPKPGGHHIPVATIGIVGYLAIGVAALFGRFWIVLELSQIGFFCALFLSYIEKFILQKWCIYCVWSQVTATAILLLSIVAVVLERQRRKRPTPELAAVP